MESAWRVPAIDWWFYVRDLLQYAFPASVFTSQRQLGHGLGQVLNLVFEARYGANGDFFCRYLGHGAKTINNAHGRHLNSSIRETSNSLALQQRRILRPA